MSLLTIKKKNREFAKWWNGWVLRVQQSRRKRDSAETKQAQELSSPEIPFAVEIFRRLQERY